MKTVSGDAPVKDEGPTAEDWIRVQQMDPAVEAAMIASLRQEPKTVTGGPTAEDWIRAQGMDPAVERSMIASLNGGVAPREQAPEVLRPVEASGGGFIKGLLNKAFNFGAKRPEGPATAISTAPVTIGPKQKTPGA